MRLSWLFIFVLMDGVLHIVRAFQKNIHLDQGFVNLAHGPNWPCHATWHWDPSSQLEIEPAIPELEVQSLKH